MGASNIRIVPIIENFMLKHAARYIPLGGAVLTSYMKKLLNQAGFQAESSMQKELIRILKERACFASLNYEDDVKNAEKYRHEYSLPDGTEISIGAERFMVPELLYHPDLMEIESPSLSESIVDCPIDCDINIRSQLLNQIFLTGGGSMFPQLEVRLKTEIEKDTE